MNLALWLQRAAQVHGPAAAVALGTSTIYDFSTFAQAAARAAGWLALRGIRPGDRVGLFMDNCTDYLPLLWGVWWAGAVAVPMNARLHTREAAWILEHSGTRLCWCDPARQAQLDASAPHFRNSKLRAGAPGQKRHP